MCGIVGYIGNKEACPILISGLHRLEYRGYDSAGIAIVSSENKLNVYKTKGKVSDLENFLKGKNVSGTVGIGHTRWATHGEPNNLNAHPQCSNSGNLALIHNGIIENYVIIKRKLEKEGFNFISETDTEVIVNLIEYIKITENVDLLSAVQIALHHVVGAYALAIIDKTDPDMIIVARKSSPLVIGIGKDSTEFFFASDATPLVEYLDKVIYLNDGEIACMRKGEKLKIVDIDNVKITPKITKLAMSLSQLEKNGYPYFMVKEIFEQSQTLSNCIRGRVNREGTNVVLSGIIDNKDKFLNAKRIIIVACGTSWHAGLIGEHLIEDMCRIPVEVEYASEFRYRDPIINRGDIVIAISQSGETADTLAAIQLAKSKGAFVYGVCNAIGSSIVRCTDSGSYIHVGPEIGVASTKAFTGQVTVLTMLALCVAKLRGTIADKEFELMTKELSLLPQKITETLLCADKVADMAKVFTYAHNFIYLGRGYNYPVALEGALKLKEISYIHAEGYPAAEMKHGPIALIDIEMPVVVVATSDRVYEKTLSNIQEIKARKGKVIAIISKSDTAIKESVSSYIEIPDACEAVSTILASIPLQLLAYNIAVNKGRNVDQPRNLAKAVTVE